MAFQEDDDFLFCLPDEESEETAIGGEIPSPTSQKLSNTVQRLVFNKAKESEKTTTSNIGEGRKAAFVAAILRKFDFLVTFDDQSGAAANYWRTLSFLLSPIDDESNSAALAFVQQGGVAVAARALHDFVVRGNEFCEENNLKMVSEILRCLQSISAASTFINFDVEWISGVLGSFVDLSEWILVKHNHQDPMRGNDLEGEIEESVRMVPGDRKDVEKLSKLFPVVRTSTDDVNFEIYRVSFLENEFRYNDPALWKLKSILDADSQNVEKQEKIVILSKINAVTYLATNRRVRAETLRDLSNTVRESSSNSGEKLEPFKSKPILGTICLLENDPEDGREDRFDRVLLTSLDGGFASVKVFGIDKGFTKTALWTMLRRLPDQARFIKPAVFVCFVQDAIPAPDLRAFDSALNVFYNISSQRTMTQSLLERNIAEALLLILRLRDQDSIVETCLKIVANLVVPAMEKRNLFLDCGGAEQLFLLGAELLEKCEQTSDSSRLNLLRHVLDCLANLAKYNDVARRRFAKIKCLILPNRILSNFGKDTAVYQAALNLTNALLSQSVTSEVWQQKVKSWSGTSRNRNECSTLNKLLMDALKVKGGKLSFDACFTKEMTQLCPPVRVVTSALKPTPEVDEILRRVAVPSTGARFYLRDDKLKLEEVGGEWNEICAEIVDLHELKTRFVQELCCAALNSRRRLTIYFGLDKDGRVRGLRSGQSDRDEFRVGIDWSLSRAFRPFLEPTMYNVAFVPVCVGEHQPKPVPDLHVVELKILHIAKEAYQLEKDGAIYFRIKDRVTQLSLQEASEFIAHREDGEKKQQLKRLRNQIEIMKAALE